MKKNSKQNIQFFIFFFSFFFLARGNLARHKHKFNLKYYTIKKTKDRTLKLTALMSSIASFLRLPVTSRICSPSNSASIGSILTSVQTSFNGLVVMFLTSLWRSVTMHPLCKIERDSRRTSSRKHMSLVSDQGPMLRHLS